MALCSKCGSGIPDGIRFCLACGTLTAADPPRTEPQTQFRSQFQPEPQPAFQSQPFAQMPLTPTAPTPPAFPQRQEQPPLQERPQRQEAPREPLPPYSHSTPSSAALPKSEPPPKGSKYAPLGPWKYIGAMLLFTIPLIDFIFMLVWTFSGSVNANLRDFARANLIIRVLMIVFAAVACVLLTFVFKVSIPLLFNDLFRNFVVK